MNIILWAIVSNLALLLVSIQFHRKIMFYEKERILFSHTILSLTIKNIEKAESVEELYKLYLNYKTTTPEHFFLRNPIGSKVQGRLKTLVLNCSNRKEFDQLFPGWLQVESIVIRWMVNIEDEIHHHLLKFL